MQQSKQGVFKMKQMGFAVCAALVAVVGAQSAMAADWIVSGNDGKYQRVAGRDTYLANPPQDTLTLLDGSVFPPKAVASFPVENGIQGPPQAVAVTPDGTIAFVAAPTRYDQTAKKLIMDTFLQIVTLQGDGAGAIEKISLGSHPQAIAINPAGTIALVTCVDGTAHVFQIEGSHVTEKNVLSLSKGRLAGASFTHDGQHALVALRDEQGVAVLNVVDGVVTDSGDRLSSGVAPYTVDVSSDGHWAVVSDVGLAGLANVGGRMIGDADALTLIDVSLSPAHPTFRSVQQITVPSLPEGVAISPDGKWIVAQTMDGSNLLPGNPGRHDHGRLVLFAIRDGHAVEVSNIAGGEASQGVIFTKDSRHVIVQYNVERQLAFFSVIQGKLVDSGKRMSLSGAPSSIRSAPR